MIYDERILSWKGLEYASILTLEGRIKIPIRIGEYQRARMDRLKGQADLLLRDGVFYLAATIDAPEETPYDPVGTLGIDLGLKYLSYDSDGEHHSGKQVDEVRERNAKLKADLQSCGTKSAKRHLKRLSGKESRFKRDVNHVISKKIVAKAKGTQRRIALEDLKGIRRGVSARRSQRSRLHSWGFYQLRQFIEYKARLSGVQVIPVYPRGTSHICPACGVEDRKNRLERDLFRCIGCGYAGHADHVAAINIAARANVNRPIVSEDFFEHTAHLQGQAPQFIGG
jgi:IS605 OrfB family transposase